MNGIWLLHTCERSERTRSALAARKVQGATLGNRRRGVEAEHGVKCHGMCCFEQPMARSLLECLFIVENFISFSQRKANVMNVHSSLKPALWGAAGGAAGLAMIGFAWG